MSGVFPNVTVQTPDMAKAEAKLRRLTDEDWYAIKIFLKAAQTYAMADYLAAMQAGNSARSAVMHSAIQGLGWAWNQSQPNGEFRRK